jgi:hypothetical protein
VNGPPSVRHLRLEVDARAALDLLAGRAVTHAEGTATRARFLEFASILRDWDRSASRRGKVEISCQPEL